MFYPKPVKDAFESVTVPAPVGGLNAFDPLAAMKETDAIVMQNWWPQSFGCAVRNGYVEWSTGMPGTVETMAEWWNLEGDGALLAWSVGSMYDVTTRAVVGAALITGLTNARWQSVVLTNAAGGFLIAVNGADDGIIYSAGGAARITAGDGIVANTWAGLDPANAIQLAVHQKRLWATERDSTRGWYLPPDAIQGTFVSFDFGPQFSKGGFLQYLATWTLDDGQGAQDLLVAVSSNGEAVVYGGTDPSDDTAWGLVGVYFVGAPVSGRRSYVKAAGDLLILTQQGVVSMTGLLVSTRIEEKVEAVKSRKIQFLISQLIASYSALNGWQMVYHPALNMLLISIPSVTAGANIQLACNMITGAWTQFVNMDAACWFSHNNQLYFGDYTGRVLNAWTGTSDNVLLDNTGGEGIETAVQQAYSYFGGRSNQKQVGMYRPVFITGGEVSYNTKVLYDYVEENLTTPSVTPLPSGSLWGTGFWGSAFWSGGSSVKKEWIQAAGMGVAGSLKMVALSNADTLWVATDYSLQQSRGIL